MAEQKVRKWAFWLPMVAIASQFYFIKELLVAFAFFAIGFAALTLVVLSLYLLQKGWELAAVRIFDSERWMTRWGARAVIGRSGEIEPGQSRRRS